MTDRPVAALRRVRPGLRVRRVLATLIVLVAVAIGVDYGAAALTESAVSREMRSQLNLAFFEAARRLLVADADAA